jgi:glycosyltransferase involved in cell wall biosynthesis
MLEDHVTFTGEVPEDNVYGLLKKAKVFVLPSLREGFGMSVLEALACGVPAVVVRAPYSAAHEIIEDGVNGIVVEPSPRSLAEAISSLLEDSAKRGLMAEAAQQAASQYDWAVIAQKTMTVYEAARRC